MMVAAQCALGLVLVPLVLAAYSAEDCWNLGLNKANLMCSNCEQLPRFNLEFLKVHCLECCQTDDSSIPDKKYAKAILEVCTCKFSAYPQIQAFVKSDRPSKFANLQIKYVRGLDPIIKLYDKDGHQVETVAIEKWNTDSVEEFLSTHLISDDTDYLNTNRV